MSQIDIVLVVIIAMQQLFFMWQVQKLVDKVMSRSYSEYIRNKETPTLNRPVRLPTEQEPEEDFGVLTEFGAQI